jgi:branched-chain amino acid transport system ATP-binding protein
LSEPLLEVRGVTGGYEDISVLRGVDLEVHEGETVALLGPNGHGKSTLLKAISGVHPATSGSIVFRGEEITQFPAHRIVAAGISYIPEERYLFADMPVLENLQLGAYTPEARPKIEENLEMVFEIFPQLAERRRQPCNTLSGGEGRMVAIARGLMSGASLLLVDEPSIGLSPGLKKGVYAAIRTINDEAGITVLLVEQEIDYALRLSQRLYLLKKGQVEFEQRTDEADINEIHRAYF